jgi:hypothetical protein
MNGKSVLWGIGIALFLTGGVGVVFLLIRHEPEFYHETASREVGGGKTRPQRSGECFTRLNQFHQDIAYQTSWNAEFREDLINSFFDEQFVQLGFDKRILPEGISAPRVAIEHDLIRLAFRYHLGPFSTIISINMRVWLTPREPNVIALELRGLYAGSLPIAAQSLLESVSETARQNNIDITWYRHQGNPVALLRFQADQDRPTYRLDHLVLEPGVIRVDGRSVEAPLRAMVPAVQNVATSN